MLEIFSDCNKHKKIYSYTNKKWVYYHNFIDNLCSITTMHRFYLPWEFLEHHTEDEIRNFIGEKRYSNLSKKTSWIENSPRYKKIK